MKVCELLSAARCPNGLSSVGDRPQKIPPEQLVLSAAGSSSAFLMLHLAFIMFHGLIITFAAEEACTLF